MIRGRIRSSAWAVSKHRRLIHQENGHRGTKGSTEVYALCFVCGPNWHQIHIGQVQVTATVFPHEIVCTGGVE